MKTRQLLTAGILTCIVTIFSVDLAYGRWWTTDPLAEKHYNHSPYVFTANNPVLYVDPDGRDWYLNNETGELYYNREITENTTMYQNQTYTRIGDNNMMGDMGSISDRYLSYNDAIDFANQNGYNINPTQQLIHEDTKTSKTQTGPGNYVTTTNGTETIINEQYGIFPADQHMRGNGTTTLHHEMGQKWYEALMGTSHTSHTYRNTYAAGSGSDGSGIVNAINIGSAIIQGNHNYVKTTTYPSWNAYNNTTRGQGHLIKYRYK